MMMVWQGQDDSPLQRGLGRVGLELPVTVSALQIPLVVRPVTQADGTAPMEIASAGQMETDPPSA